MTSADLGFNENFEKFRDENKLVGFTIGRVALEHKERYIVKTENGEIEAEITGNMRFSAQGREDFPAVGDWVALQAYDTDFGIIHRIFPRFSIIKRQAVAKFGEVQIIAVNIDFAFIVQEADRDFNLNRIERYLTICYSSKVKPVIILSKTDLINPAEAAEIKERIAARINNVPVFALSNITKEGCGELKNIIEKGKTYCLLGSSGVGKSTLINNLAGSEMLKTDAISEVTSKGRHITTRRELVVLENGGILIDNPGMREVGVADVSEGLEITFDKISELSGNCRFADCTHTSETGCAVLEAVETDEISEKSYSNYLKMEKEKAYFESTSAERRKKDKDFGKMLKNYKKDMKKNKFK